MFHATLVYEGEELDLGLVPEDVAQQLRDLVRQSHPGGITIAGPGRDTTIPMYVLHRSILTLEEADDADAE